MNKSIMAFILACSCAGATAQTPEKPLTADAELGLLLTSGNTESTAFTSKLHIQQELTRWRTDYVLEALYKKDQIDVIEGDVTVEDSRVTAEKYFASAQSDYKLDSEQRGLFVFGSYEEDKFSGYDYQASVAAGYSDRLFNTTNAFLDYSVGPGWSFNRTEPVLDDAGEVLEPSETESSAMVRVSALYQYNFSDNAKFSQSFASDMALESDANTKSKAETALTTNITRAFAMKASITVTHNTEVPPDRHSTDTHSAITLVYSL